MQSVQPIGFTPLVQPIDRIREVQEIKPAGDTADAGLDTDGRPSDPFTPANTTRSRDAQEAAGEAPSQFPPLDTRQVGDFDIIDPDRPTTRLPDPIITMADILPAWPLPDPEFLDNIDPSAEVEAIDGETRAEAADAAGDTVREEAPGDTAARGEGSEGTRGRERDDAEEPRRAAETGREAEPVSPTPTGPPSPQAKAADVPDPPPAGSFDLRR